MESVAPVPTRQLRIFNTPFESGLRSVILLTACYPQCLGLHKLVVLDHLLVHSGDIEEGPPSMHPKEGSRVAELLVRRQLVAAGLSLMGTRNLVVRAATPVGFLYRAGDDAGSFVDLLSSSYTVDLKMRAQWLTEHIVSLADDAFAELVRDRLDQWTTEFQFDDKPGA